MRIAHGIEEGVGHVIDWLGEPAKITVTIHHDGIRYNLRVWPEGGGWVVECRQGRKKPVDRWWWMANTHGANTPWAAIAQMVEHLIGKLEAK